MEYEYTRVVISICNDLRYDKLISRTEDNPFPYNTLFEKIKNHHYGLGIGAYYLNDDQSLLHIEVANKEDFQFVKNEIEKIIEESE